MHSAHIQFKDKKTLNKFKRNLKNGKGTNIKPSDIHGDGIFDNIKAIGKSKITKGIVKALAPSIAGVVQTATGSPTAGLVAKGAINAYTGSGLLDVVKKVANSNITKGVAKALAPAIAQQVSQSTGSNLAGSVANASLKAYAGSGVGIVSHSDGVALPSNVLPSGPNQALDQKATMRAKMAKVRAHRKKKGGSILPLR
jgi:hypothetical protein